MDRIKTLRTVFIIILIGLALRLGFIAVVKYQDYTLAAASQRMEFLPSSSVFRGVIYDRDMFPLSSSSLAPHIIGYVNSEGEGMGLQMAYNDYLSVEWGGVAVETSANREPISGLGILTIGRTRKGIKTTLDHQIQQICQDVLDENVPRGACVVADVKTGDILAIASTPSFDDVSKYLNSNSGELLNRAISTYDVGSLFKIVTVAAALEKGITTPLYNCTGRIEIAGREFLCNNIAGHDMLSLSRGFALSCNIPFFTIGQQLGTDTINKLAREFGFSEASLGVGKTNLEVGEASLGVGETTLGVSEASLGVGETTLGIGEAVGSLEKNTDPQSAANMSIGQGGFSATPLQIADMLTTIANGGKRVGLTLVSEYVADNGVDFEPIPRKKGEQIISSKTAREIKNMMIEAVKNGTGQNAQIDGVVVAGKTSSAQTGWVAENGELMVHGWFGGFFPAENPRYVCVVLVEDGKSGATSAAPGFKEIGEKILVLTN